MRIAKVVRRTNVASVPQFGTENGKVYIDDTYEDGSRRLGAKLITLDQVRSAALFSTSQLREAISSRTSPKLEAAHTVRMRYHTVSGVDYSDWVSTLGTTRGTRYSSRNSRIIDDKGNVVFRVSNTASPNDLVPQTVVDPSTVCKIIHETNLAFIVYVIADDSCSLHRVMKTTLVSVVLFRGQFSIHLLGKTKEGEEYYGYTTFLLLLNSTVFAAPNYTVWPQEDRPNAYVGQQNAAGAYLLGFLNHGNITGEAQGMWMRKLVTFSSPYHAFYADSALCNQRVLVDGDSSLVETVGDFVEAFSFVGVNPELVTEGIIAYNTTTTLNPKINDNLCLFRVEMTGDREFEISHTKLQLPQEYLDAQWQTFGDNRRVGNVAGRPIVDLCLAAGKSWSYVHEGNRFLCVLLDGRGFEAYATTDAYTASHYASRKAPNLPPVLLKWQVNEMFQPLPGAEQTITKFPVGFGADIREISMLLRNGGKEVVVPSQMFYSKTADRGFYGVRAIAFVDAVNETFKVVEWEAVNGRSSVVRALFSVGVEDDRLFVIDGADNLLLIDDGPTATLELNETLTGHDITVTVSEPSKVVLRADRKVFEGSFTLSLEVESSAVVNVTHEASNKFSIHVTECEPLEEENEED